MFIQKLFLSISLGWIDQPCSPGSIEMRLSWHNGRLSHKMLSEMLLIPEILLRVFAQILKQYGAI